MGNWLFGNQGVQINAGQVGSVQVNKGRGQHSRTHLEVSVDAIPRRQQKKLRAALAEADRSSSAGRERIHQALSEAWAELMVLHADPILPLLTEAYHQQRKVRLAIWSSYPEFQHLPWQQVHMRLAGQSIALGEIPGVQLRIDYHPRRVRMRRWVWVQDGLSVLVLAGLWGAAASYTPPSTPIIPTELRIEGRVFTPAGSPVAGAQVALPVPLDTILTTDAFGDFRWQYRTTDTLPDSVAVKITGEKLVPTRQWVPLTAGSNLWKLEVQRVQPPPQVKVYINEVEDAELTQLARALPWPSCSLSIKVVYEGEIQAWSGVPDNFFRQGGYLYVTINQIRVGEPRWMERFGHARPSSRMLIERQVRERTLTNALDLLKNAATDAKDFCI